MHFIRNITYTPCEPKLMRLTPSPRNRVPLRHLSNLTKSARKICRLTLPSCR